MWFYFFFFFSSRRRHTRSLRDWSSDVCSSDLLGWHRANPRELVAVEQALQVRVGRVEITGRVDRLERGDDGSAIVVDLKTGTSRPPDGDLGRNPQLGVYQLAVLLGAFEALGLTERSEERRVGKECRSRWSP